MLQRFLFQAFGDSHLLRGYGAPSYDLFRQTSLTYRRLQRHRLGISLEGLNARPVASSPQLGTEFLVYPETTVYLNKRGCIMIRLAINTRSVQKVVVNVRLYIAFHYISVIYEAPAVTRFSNKLQPTTTYQWPKF